MSTSISLTLLVDMYFYQLEKDSPLVFTGWSLSPIVSYQKMWKSNLVAQHLVDDILRAQNSGFDFAGLAGRNEDSWL